MKPLLQLTFFFFIVLCLISSSESQNSVRRGGNFIRKYNLVKCPEQAQFIYRQVCNYLQSFYVRTPDDGLLSYLRGAMQEAANRIIKSILYPNDKTVNIWMVKRCMRNFQDQIDFYNNKALKEYRKCNKKCPADAGMRFTVELEKVAFRYANCIKKRREMQ
uniref:Putative secreted salivary protein n=1 Tax=Culicoides sonorensis TaxID=179676 RepID=Q66UB1_CULSO|nr:putative secreted salivary protein [Culicoides sonorensis]